MNKLSEVIKLILKSDKRTICVVHSKDSRFTRMLVDRVIKEIPFTYRRSLLKLETEDKNVYFISSSQGSHQLRGCRYDFIVDMLDSDDKEFRDHLMLSADLDSVYIKVNE